MAARFDMLVDQGSYAPVTYTLKLNGALVDLTGATAVMMARNSYDDPAPFLTLTSAGGGLTLGGAAGTVTVNWDVSTTWSVTAYSGFYDLAVTVSGHTTRMLQGTIKIDRWVTH